MEPVTSQYFKDFTKLSRNVWYIDSHGSSQRDPDLVIVSSWMGAAPRYIAKYILGYQRLFPGSAILVITNEVPDLTYRSRTSQIEHLKPALAIIEKYQSHTPRKILLHTFSNGGSLQAVLLAQMYKALHDLPLPVNGLILDSAPGSEAYWPAFRAFTATTPTILPLKWLFMAFVHVSLFFWLAWIKIFAQSTVLSRLRRDLNRSELFPLTTPRVYIYSKTDQLVLSEYVEAHAKESSDIGFDVEMEEFKQSRHVGHLMKDPERYWAIVKILAQD
jgi:pimeloyl-ACP methyl ester carboxylesterase